MGTAAATAPSQCKREVRRRECGEQPRVARERLLVGRHDGGAAVRARCGSSRRRSVRRWLRRRCRCADRLAIDGRVVGERRRCEPRIAEMRAARPRCAQSRSLVPVSASSAARRSMNDVANADPTVPQPMRPRRNSTGAMRASSPSTRPEPRCPEIQKIPEARKAAGTRGLLAVCLTWPQYAANHHEAELRLCTYGKLGECEGDDKGASMYSAKQRCLL